MAKEGERISETISMAVHTRPKIAFQSKDYEGRPPERKNKKMAAAIKSRATGLRDDSVAI